MKKLWIENIDNPAKEYAEVSSTIDFEDKSNDMIAWDKARGIMDWSRRRDKIKPLFYAITGVDLSTYGNLTAEQKEIGARYFLVPKVLRIGNGTVTAEQDLINATLLAIETKASRITCYNAMREYLYSLVIGEVITLSNTQLFFRDIRVDLDCFLAANDPLFKQFIFGEGVYVGVFASKPYYSIDLQNKLISIYNEDY